MKIKINGSYLSKEATDNSTVGQVYEQLKNEIYSGRKVITDIFVDGSKLSRSWKDRDKLNLPVNRVNELELFIDEPDRLSKIMLNDCGELSDALLKKTSSLAYQFRVGEEVDANNNFANFLEELNLIINTIDQAIHKNTAITDDIRGKAKATGDNLIPVLDRIYKAQAAGDYITIADEIEYNMPEMMTNWTATINEAKNCLEENTRVQN